MEKIFLSYSFDAADLHTRMLLGSLDTILRAHGLRFEDGAALGGGPLTPVIQGRIQASDALISVLAPRGVADAQGLFDTSQWVRDELQYARAINKPCVAVVFTNVRQTPGMGDDRERIDYDPANPAPALLKLVAMLGVWRQTLGRTINIRVEPVELARQLVSGNGAARCEARVFPADGEPGDWREVRVSKQVGGAFVTLRAPDGGRVQLRASVAGERWSSVEAQQWVQVMLEKE